MNLANLTQEEKDKINVDLAASGVAYKERLAFYRERSKKLPDANSVQYLKTE
ncbi:hypothetical protein ABDX07_003415 [Proteus mirabilis]